MKIKTILATIAFSIQALCIAGVIVGCSNSEKFVGIRPAEATWDHIESEDGAILAWVEKDEEGEHHQYQTRIPASNLEADEYTLPWDMQRVQEWDGANQLPIKNQ